MAFGRGSSIRFNKNFNVNRVVKSLVRTILALYVGGTIMSVFGSVMAGTCSPFYQGISLIGWSLGPSSNASALTGSALTNFAACATGGGSLANAITVTSGSGVLAVIGIISIAQIVTEFISW